MTVQKINSLGEFNEAIKHDWNLINFSASWCFYCTRMDPILESLARNFKTVSFLTIDIDECPELCEDYSIEVVPTYVLIKDGEKIGKICCGNKEILQNFLLENI
jgi:thioredoxin 1